MDRLTTLLQRRFLGLHLTTLIIICAGVFMFAILLLLSHRIIGSDDTVFQEQIKPFSTLFDWLHYRYFSWSGRIFSESFVYLLSSAPLIYWKVISLVLYSVFIIILFAYYRLLHPASHKLWGATSAMIIVLLPFLINPSVFFQGSLWVTGSMNYFWPVVLGLVASYPTAHYIARRALPHRIINIIALISGIMACTQEQVGAVIVTLLFCVICLNFVHRHKEQQQFIYLGVSFAIFATIFFVTIKAPGNEQRLLAETATWLPDFYSIPLIEHISYGYRWVLDSLVNRTGPLLPVMWVGFLAFFVSSAKHKTLLAYTTMTILTVAVGLVIVKYLGVANYLFEFYPTWKTAIPKVSGYLPLLVWPVIIVVTIFAPIIYYRNVQGIYYSLLIASGFAATAIVALSPTMYASGLRTLFVTSVILTLALLPLVKELIQRRNQKLIYVATITAMTIVGLQYLSALIRYFE